MSRKKYVVELSSAEHEHLGALICKGKASARAILKARILLKADQGRLGPGWTDDRIVEALDTNPSMVTRVRRQLVEEGMAAVLIPACINQNPCAHFLCPIDMIVHVRSISLFQASDEIATISSYDLKMRLLSQLSRMYCHIFSTGFSSGDLGGKNSSVMLGGITSLSVVCHPA